MVDVAAPAVVDLDGDVREALARFMADRGELASNDEAVKLILREWLTGAGYLPVPPEDGD